MNTSAKKKKRSVIDQTLETKSPIRDGFSFKSLLGFLVPTWLSNPPDTKDELGRNTRKSDVVTPSRVLRGLPLSSSTHRVGKKTRARTVTPSSIRRKEYSKLKSHSVNKNDAVSENRSVLSKNSKEPKKGSSGRGTSTPRSLVPGKKFKYAIDKEKEQEVDRREEFDGEKAKKVYRDKKDERKKSEGLRYKEKKEDRDASDSDSKDVRSVYRLGRIIPDSKNVFSFEDVKNLTEEDMNKADKKQSLSASKKEVTPPRKHRRFKKYDRAKGHIIINPSSESEPEFEPRAESESDASNAEDFSSSSQPQKAVIVQNGTNLYHDLESSIINDLMSYKEKLELEVIEVMSDSEEDNLLENSDVNSEAEETFARKKSSLVSKNKTVSRPTKVNNNGVAQGFVSDDKAIAPATQVANISPEHLLAENEPRTSEDTIPEETRLARAKRQRLNRKRRSDGRKLLRATKIAKSVEVKSGQLESKEHPKTSTKDSTTPCSNKLENLGSDLSPLPKPVTTSYLVLKEIVSASPLSQSKDVKKATSQRAKDDIINDESRRTALKLWKMTPTKDRKNSDESARFLGTSTQNSAAEDDKQDLNTSCHALPLIDQILKLYQIPAAKTSRPQSKTDDFTQKHVHLLSKNSFKSPKVLKSLEASHSPKTVRSTLHSQTPSQSTVPVLSRLITPEKTDKNSSDTHSPGNLDDWRRSQLSDESAIIIPESSQGKESQQPMVPNDDIAIDSSSGSLLVSQRSIVSGLISTVTKDEKKTEENERAKQTTEKQLQNKSASHKKREILLIPMKKLSFGEEIRKRFEQEGNKFEGFGLGKTDWL